MIRLVGLTKRYHANGVTKTVADSITLAIPDRVPVALLGRNGAGKTSLLRIIAGTMQPSSGEIRVDGRVSWPVGFSGSFHGDLTGAQNARFVARIYGVESDLLVAFVRDFAELGPHFNLPMRTYSQGMRARLAFGVSMGIDFDTYLIDEITSVGDAAFREKSEAVLGERLKGRGAVVVSHNMGLLRRMCRAALVVEEGRAAWFDDLEAGIAQHERNMAVPVGDG